MSLSQLTRRRGNSAGIEGLESRVLLSVATVTTTADSGPGSLRQAILTVANIASNFQDPGVIRFDIPGAGVHTIAPLSPLPMVQGYATIDATTQPGYSGAPLIELNGSAAGAGADGLRLYSGVKTIRGLAINGFDGNGAVALLGSVAFEANFVGVDPTGSVAKPNGGAGIFAEGGSITVGAMSAEATAAARNVISGNRGPGIRVGLGTGSDPSLPGPFGVFGNYIGTDATGAVSIGNGQDGIFVDASIRTASVTVAIGGPGVGNVISGNGGSGIHLVKPGNTVIRSNFIGTDAAGAHALPNGAAGDVNSLDGITATGLGAPRNDLFLVGGPTVAERNVISGNLGAGIRVVRDTSLSSAMPASAEVRGNYIGTDATGNVDLGNGEDGIRMTGLSATVFSNLISGNHFDGLNADGTDYASAGARTEGNFIGTNAAGTMALGNDGDGVELLNFQSLGLGFVAQRVGPPAALDPSRGGGNLISGNVEAGVRLMQDAPLTSGLRRARVQNNYIGTDVTGTAALPNGGGVVLVGPGFIIGGTGSGGNVISGNRGNGIMVADTAGSAATAPLISANRVGVAANADTALGNGRHGVFLLNASNVSLTGSASDPGAFANTIAFNGGDGVQVPGATSQHNRVSGNRVFSNTGLGIDLGGDGVTPNDPLDADAGPNGLQNFPVITAAATGRSRVPTTVVQFRLNSAPNSSYDVEFFASPTRDPSGYGEGARYLGRTTVTTDAAGNATARAIVARAAAGSWLTATATLAEAGGAGSTSEFSAAVRVFDRFAVGRRGQYDDGGAAGAAPVAPTSVATVAGVPQRRAPRRLLYEV